MEKYTGKILLASMGKPKSVNELSENLSIPIAVCYRKIKFLEDSSLMFCSERKLTRSGKRLNMYKYTVKNSHIVLERNYIWAIIEMIDGTTDDESYDINISSNLEMTKQQV